MYSTNKDQVLDEHVHQLALRDLDLVIDVEPYNIIITVVIINVPVLLDVLLVARRRRPCP